MLPHTQIVKHSGNETLLKAVELSILSHSLGWPLHLHAEGMRGTGKTTVLRSARGRMPMIRRIKGCMFNCIPEAPHCPQHRDLDAEELQRLGTEQIPMPFLEISHSAKLGTVVGTIDLQKVFDPDRPGAALLPGTIAKAHRGIVFVDEINRLADTAPELVDVLLDVMGTKPGRLQIEESGLPPVELPVQVAVWAASNPDEEPGPLEDIRRQLSDRFDLAIHVTGPETVDQVQAVLERTASGIPRAAAPVAHRLHRPVAPRGSFPGVPPELSRRLAALYVRFGIESLRAMEAWQWTARLHAWHRGAGQVAMDDLTAVAPWIFQHRIDPGLLAQMLRALQSEGTPITAEMAGATATAAAAPGPYEGGDAARHQGAAAQGNHGQGSQVSYVVPDHSLLGRVREWLKGAPAQPAGQSGQPGEPGQPGGRDANGRHPAGAAAGQPGGGRTWGAQDAPAEIPAPPHKARSVQQLSDAELWQRFGLTDRDQA